MLRKRKQLMEIRRRPYRHPVAETGCKPHSFILCTRSSLFQQDPQIKHHWFCSSVQNCKSSDKPQNCKQPHSQKQSSGESRSEVHQIVSDNRRKKLFLPGRKSILDWVLWKNRNLLYSRRRIWVLSLVSEWVKLPSRRIKNGVSFSTSPSKTPLTPLHCLKRG